MPFRNVTKYIHRVVNENLRNLLVAIGCSNTEFNNAVKRG